MQRLSIKTPTGPLEYSIAHRPRVSKRLHMELDESGGLVVIAPGHWSKRQVRNILSQNVPRIERFLANARKRQLKPLRFTHGEFHLYLGESYPLVIYAGQGRNAGVCFNGVEIQIGIGQKAQKDPRLLLHAWYRQQAFQIFSERLTEISSRTAWARGREVPLKLRNMKRTWGNCSSSGVIKLNTHLIKAPISVIDSVVAHELCHLMEMNHGRAFYSLLEGLNPNWKKDRKTLVSNGSAYLLQ